MVCPTTNCTSPSRVPSPKSYASAMRWRYGRQTAQSSTATSPGVLCTKHACRVGEAGVRRPEEPVPLLPEERGSAAGNAALIADDIRTLQRLGYQQELLRRMSGFSNYAISLSIICILAGGITSFHLGLCSVGGPSVSLGWPLVSLLALAFAATMGQVASAFPTAGGLYHWGSILGGRGWGWATAWFNLAGLVTATAAVNVGAFEFVLASLGLGPGPADLDLAAQAVGVILITGSQAAINHLGIGATARLTDF